MLCSAVLMHLRREEVPEAALVIRGVLKPGGRLLVSVPLERPGLDVEHRDAHGRLFTPLPADELRRLLQRLGFRLLEQWRAEDAAGREGMCVAKLGPGDAFLPGDHPHTYLVPNWR